MSPLLTGKKDKKKEEEEKPGTTSIVFSEENMQKLLKSLHDNGSLKGYLDRLGISYDESNQNLDESVALCGHCSAIVADHGVMCNVCQVWFHFDDDDDEGCSGIDRKFEELLISDNIWYICNKCKHSDLSLNKRLDKHHKNIEEKLHDVHSKVESVKEVLNKVGKFAEQPASSSAPPSTYAGVVKKHLLVVKSTDTEKATEKKEKISNALEGLQIVDAQFRQSGNVVLNFETEHQRDEAAVKVGELDDLSATKTKKLFPKIMVCNVSTQENKDNLVQTILKRNDYLMSIDGIMDKIKLVFDKDAAGNTKHYILRCHPDVRGLIRQRGDEIKLEWGIYKIRDRYFATMCYHCLNYGHVRERCPSKDNAPCCRKCAGDHSARDCSSSVKKCINCVRVDNEDVNHSASEMCCPVLKGEIAKIRNKTDHGF